MNIQELIDSMGEMDRRTRSNYHVTLGKALMFLAAIEAGGHGNIPVVFTGLSDMEGKSPTNPHSYRGYYSDIALEPCNSIVSVSDLYASLKHVCNKELTGYKGGEFIMGPTTPMWCANEGSSYGGAIIDIQRCDGLVELRLKERP